MFPYTVGQEEDCPRIIQSKLLRTFTVETFNKGRYDGDGTSYVCHLVKYLETAFALHLSILLACTLELLACLEFDLVGLSLSYKCLLQ